MKKISLLLALVLLLAILSGEALAYRAEVKMGDNTIYVDDGAMNLRYESDSEGIGMISRDELSHLLREISQMHIFLKEKGKKVNHIEVLQEGDIILSTYNVDSYSTVGKYELSDFKINPFKYPGENNVTINFYSNDTLVASYPYTFSIIDDVKLSFLYMGIGMENRFASYMAEVIGISEMDEVSLSFKAPDGTIIDTFNNTEKVYRDWNGAYVFNGAIEIPPNLLKDGDELQVLLKVNGQIYETEKRENVSSDADIRGYADPTTLPEEIKIEIVNPSKFINPRAEIWQNGVKTGETTDIRIEVRTDKREYFTGDELYDAEDMLFIKMEDRLFTNVGGEFDLKLFIDTENGIKEIFSHTYLPPKDDFSSPSSDNWLAEDGLDIKAHVVKTMYNVPKDKVFTVRFNKPIDLSSLNNDNIYVIDKISNQRIDIDLDKLRISGYGEGNSEYILTAALPDNISYNSNQPYILVLEPGIKGLNGEKLLRQTVMYFTVK